MRPHTTTVLAAFLVALEGLGVLVLAGLQVPPLMAGDVATLPSALALIVLTIIFGIGVLAFSVGIFRGHTWGRSGGIVTQLLLFAVGLGAITGVLYPHPVLGISLIIPAAVTFVLIISSAKRNPDLSRTPITEDEAAQDGPDAV